MKRFAVPLALVLVVALPAQASADIGFRGRSGQERLVTMRTDDAGMLEKFEISWRAPCRQPGFRYTNATKQLPPFDALTRDRFVDAGSYRERFDNGFRAILSARAVGNRVSEQRWRGIFRIRIRVFRGSTLVDRCYKRTAWRVARRG
jgi:hypothetical protein